MDETILVVGGTGMLGEPVARRLAASNKRVRVMSRDPARARAHLGDAFEIVQGDVEDRASLANAVRGCVGVHISLEGRASDWDVERRAAQAVASVAKNGSVRRITTITGVTVCAENTWFPLIRAKLDAENALRESGVPFTIFRATAFMEMLLNLVQGSVAMLIGKQTASWHFVAAADYAAMVASAFDTELAAGKTLYVHGPEAWTIPQAVERYRDLCAPQARLVRVPFWVLGIMARMPSRRKLREIGLPMMRYLAQVQELGDPSEANALLGAPTTTLEQWCRARHGGR